MHARPSLFVTPRFRLALGFAGGLIAMMCVSCVKEPNLGAPVIAPVTQQQGAETKTPQGGHDGGGGTAPGSTDADVEATIKRAMKLATDDDLRRNLFQRLAVEWAQEQEDDRVYYKIELDRLFPKLRNIEKRQLLWDDANLKQKLFSPTLEVLKTKVPVILKDRYCPAPDKQNAEAAVTKFDHSGELCFSSFALRRIPKSALLKEVLGLLMHETIHLAGGNEAEAQKWQSSMGEYFAHQFGYIEQRRIDQEHFSVVFKAAMTLSLAGLGYLQDNPTQREEARAVAAMTSVAMQLSMLPKLYDPIALELSFNPKHPELLNNYVNSVLATLQKGWSLMSLGLILSTKTSEVPEGQSIFPKLPTGKLLDKYMEEMTDLALIMMRNLAAFKKGTEKSVCLLPQGHLTRLLTMNYTEGADFMLGPSSLPPRVCDPGTTPAVRTNPNSDMPESANPTPAHP